MIFFIRYLLITCVLVFLAGCGTYRNIYSNYDKSIDFSVYETFAWAPDSTLPTEQDMSAYDNDIIRNNAKNYITHNLSNRGMLVDIDSPDAVLQLVLLNEKKERIITYHMHHAPVYSGYYFHNRYYYPYYYPYYRYYTWHGWYGWGYHPYWDDHATYTKSYVKGTITINMYDRELQKLVWTGSAEGDIYDPAYVKYDVHPAIDRIMKTFPIKSVSRKKGEEQKMKERIVRSNGNGSVGFLGQ